jgi:LysR family transcriptional activator of nhaA
MSDLNYKHLHYFWTVAREGGVTAAAEKLHVSQPAISTQIRKLELALGQELFDRSGRSLVLTPEGRIVMEFADEIFALGRELTDTLEGRLEGRPMRLVVGVADSIAKTVAHRLLLPAFQLDDPVHVVVHEDRPDRLLARLATHDLDLVLTDIPIPPNVSVQAFNHPLGESSVAIFGAPDLVATLDGDFPACLDRAPFLLPAHGFALRRSLDDWFAAEDIQPRIVAEIEDSALTKVFGESGHGFFAAPTLIAEEVGDRYQLEVVGTTDAIRERYFAITAERRIKHPGAVAISRAARTHLFSADSGPATAPR